MHYRKVKLTFWQSIGPVLITIKQSPFIAILSIIALLFSENAFVAHLMPTMIASSGLLDAAFCFGLALIIQIVAILPFALLLAWWFDNDAGSGQDLYSKFRRELDDEFARKKENVWANAEQEMLK